MTIVATVLFTAVVMGYPLHRVAIQRDEARKQADAAHELLQVIFRKAVRSNVVSLRREGGR